MPELPEVETVVRRLKPKLVGREFTGVIVRWPNSVRTGITALKRELPGLIIDSVTRRGKYLVLSLSSDRYLLLHLKMSGDLLIEPTDSKGSSHVRTVFHLDNGYDLRFQDARKFGRVYLVNDCNQVTGHLGPEPLSSEFTFEVFLGLCRQRRGRVKPLLLNQSFIAGLGNIYVDESCYLSKVHPLRKIDSLSQPELRLLYLNIRKVLSKAIDNHGSSFDWAYRGGSFQQKLKVYGRDGKPCFRCKTVIERITVGARSTHFCSRCQKI